MDWFKFHQPFGWLADWFGGAKIEPRSQICRIVGWMVNSTSNLMIIIREKHYRLAVHNDDDDDDDEQGTLN